MTIDLSKITDLELREEAARLFEDWHKMDGDESSWVDPSVAEKLRLLDIEYYERRNAIVLGGPTSPCDLAQEAYQNFDSPEILGDEDGGAVRCALSGIPVWEDDEFLEDSETGEIILRCFTDLPPRVSEEADEVEEAA